MAASVQYDTLHVNCCSTSGSVERNRPKSIKAFRTPKERFAFLSGFPYAPQYFDDLPGYEGLRMAYDDEGPANAESSVLYLHGEPTWSDLLPKNSRSSPMPVIAPEGWKELATASRPQLPSHPANPTEDDMATA